MKRTILTIWALFAAIFLQAEAELIARWDFEESLANAAAPQCPLASLNAAMPLYVKDAKSGTSAAQLANEPGKPVKNAFFVSNPAELAAKIGKGGSWTFTAWIKPATANAPDSGIAIFSTDKWKVYLNMRMNSQMCLYFNENPQAAASVVRSGWWAHPDNWSLVAVVFDAPTKKISIWRYCEETDPTDLKSKGLMEVASGKGIADLSAFDKFAIGFNVAGNFAKANQFGFSGLIDDVRLYNHALTKEELSALIVSARP